MNLSFTITDGPRQHSYSRVRVSDSRLHQPGEPGLRIYAPGTGLSSFNLRHWVSFSLPPTTRKHIRGTRIEREVEIYATILANKPSL
jgi:hypothetical protein